MSINPKVVAFQSTPAYVHHRAMLNRRENNIVDALELMRRAVEASPENSEYRLDLAELYCEVGCYEQSSRLLLDMIAEGRAPAECYYGLALNQLNMNDVKSARHSLAMYRRRAPLGDHAEAADALEDELELMAMPTSPASRSARRAAQLTERACDAMKVDAPERACRLFERSLALAPGRPEIRALFAMALLMRGQAPRARRETERAAAAGRDSVRALCVSAQVLGMLGEEGRAAELTERARSLEPVGSEFYLLLYTLAELGMDAQVAETTRIGLQDTPFDRNMLHMRAVALKRIGARDEELERFWARILRIDPDDSIARYYQEQAQKRALDGEALSYEYQVPGEESARRLHALLEVLPEGRERIRAQWAQDEQFRRLTRWALESSETPMRRAAIAILTEADAPDAKSLLRQLLFSSEAEPQTKMLTVMLLNTRGSTVQSLMPISTGLLHMAFPDGENLLARMPVPDRQLVRYAAEVLVSRFHIEGTLRTLAVMWMGYRLRRGTQTDPLRAMDSAAAALCWSYMTAAGQHPRPDEVARAFGCPVRQMTYYAKRISTSLDGIEEITPDEDL